jgi:hypothetical protein
VPAQPERIPDSQGGVPKVQAALELYDILSESNIDLRQPVGLEEQLLKDDVLDSEVGQSMLQLLQVRTDMRSTSCLHMFTANSASPLLVYG